jgi:hypothetical protein
MRDDNLPRSLHDLSDDELLDRAFEPEFLHQLTPLEVELLWRLAAAVHAVEQAQVEQRRMLAALWRENSTKTAAENRGGTGRSRSQRNPGVTQQRKSPPSCGLSR